jgi:hypothetical protein
MREEIIACLFDDYVLAENQYDFENRGGEKTRA